MIEPTEQPAQELEAAEGTPPRVSNPRTGEDYDDSSWTREELEALAQQAGEGIGWDDMDEYDQLPE